MSILKKTGIELPTGLTAGATTTEITRIMVDLRRDEVRVDMATTLDGEPEGTPALASHHVRWNGVNTGDIAAISAAAMTRLKAEDPRLADAVEA